jgi:hypothetical protein
MDRKCCKYYSRGDCYVEQSDISEDDEEFDFEHYKQCHGVCEDFTPSQMDTVQIHRGVQ